MANTLKPKRSNTVGKNPTTSDLVSGELGVNMADQKIWIHNGTSVVQIGAGKLSKLGDVTFSNLQAGEAITWDGSKFINAMISGGGGGSGSVTSVAVSVPTGLSVTGSPITSSGTIAISLQSGYSIPTTASQGNWDTAYSDRLKWDGSASGLNASTARTSLGLVIGTDVQAYDGDLAAIAALAGTSGILKKTGANTWALDTSAYITGISSSDVTTALGFTPYNATNPSGYVSTAGARSAISVTQNLTYNSTTGVITGPDLSSYLTGITSTQVTTALGYTPYNASNPSNYITQAGARLAISVTQNLTYNSTTGVITGPDLSSYLTGITSTQVTTALGFTPEDASKKGAANGYASLDGSGLVPASQLPSYVDDVLEYTNLAGFPGTGATGKIYVALDTNKTYRWSGSAYVEISASPGSTDSVSEGTTNLYFTQARARASISATQNLTYNSTTGVITGPDLSGYLTSATAASTYLTSATAASTYQTITGMSSYLTTSAAASTYQTKSAMSSYLTSSEIASAYQALDADLTAIAGLTGTTGLLKKTAANTWTLDTSTYLTSISSSDVTSALGFTPYNATNPNGYITSTALSGYLTSASAASTYQTQAGMSSYLTTSTAASTYQPLDGDLTAIAALAGTTGILKKTAANTWALDTTAYLTSISSSDVTTALGFTPYNATNPSGYITSAALSGYLTSSTASSTYQPLDADLTAIAALTGTSGFLKTNGSGTWTVDTATYLTSASNLNASNLTSGTVATARLGTGTADATTYLRGDGTWATVSAGSSVTTSESAPSSPTNGNLWWNSGTGVMNIYYNDGDSSQWVEISKSNIGGGGGGVTTGKAIAMAMIFGG